MSNAFEKMDRMYRHQRYFYDATRKYYLFGRDRLIEQMPVNRGDSVLEAGCGTGRNLIILAKKNPEARFFGLDASAAMLKTAQQKVDAKNLKNVFLKTALADDFSFDQTFDLEEKFDLVFFSYAVSIIPPWRESLENALRNLKAGKSLFIVDFYDQRDLPGWFQKILKGWLKKFHVQFREESIHFLKDLEKRGTGVLRISPLYRRYSFIAEFQKSP